MHTYIGHVFHRKNIVYYEHLDFIWGLDAPSVVYDDIIAIAKKLLLNWVWFLCVSVCLQ